MKTKILFVCLGNICRSPAAEAVFLKLIEERCLEEEFEVDSAGTGGWHVGKKADSRMRKAAEKREIYIQSRARQLSIEDLENFDLIMTMDNENLATVKTLCNEVRYELSSKVRPILSYSNATNADEVPDPYYGGENGFEIVLDLLQDACKGILDELIVSG